IGEPQHAHLAQTPPVATPKEIVLALPANAAAGRYRVHYSLAAHHHDGALSGIKEPASESGKLALSSARWYDAVYRKAQKADVPGAYSDHPLFMIAQLQATGFSGERMDFDRELQLGETLA